MNEGVVLDTTIIVDHFRRDAVIAAQLKNCPALYIPLTALGELLFGAYNSRFEAKALTQVEEFLRICAVLTPGEVAAHHYGHIKTELHRAGRPIPQNDIWIAAIAMEHQLPLATRDQHFSHVPGLKVLNW